MAYTSFNLSLALQSESYAHECWHNYYAGGNTMGIRESDIGEVEKQWNSKVSKWKLQADSTDENKYMIDDDDKQTSQAKGAEKAAEAGSVNKGANTAQAATSAVGGAVVALGGLSGGLKIGSKTIIKPFNNGVNKFLSGSKTENGTKVAKNNKASDIATVILAALVAAKFWIDQPNKDARDAAKNVMEELGEQQALSAQAQEDMDEAMAETEASADEAAEAEEETNDAIAEHVTKMQAYHKSYAKLKNKNGPLTEDEKNQMTNFEGLITEIGGEDGKISKTYAEGQEVVAEKSEEIEEWQTSFDTSADIANETQGLTDALEDWDETSRIMCHVEAAGQTLNGIGAGIAAARLSVKGFWNWAFAAIGYAAAASSGLAASKEEIWAADIGNEIDLRRETQEVNQITLDQYDEQIEAYEELNEDTMERVGAVPDDVDVTGEEISKEFEKDGAASGGILAQPQKENNTTEPKDNKIIKEKEEKKE